MQHASTKTNGVRCRCSNKKCRKRKTLKHHPSTFEKVPRCDVCGSPLTPDAYRNKRGPKDHPPRCTCDGDDREESNQLIRGGRDGNAPHRRGQRGCKYWEPF